MKDLLLRMLADAVVVFHLLFVLFAGLGGFLVLRWPWLAWLHLPAAVWGFLVEACNWFCPLTPLEVWLRRLGGEAAYRGDFIEHYVLPLLYPARMTRGVQLGLAALVIVVNGAVYTRLLLRRRVQTEARR